MNISKSSGYTGRGDVSSPPFACVILAAGLGKRMKSGLPKVLHELKGRPLIDYVVETARSCGASRIIAVVGYKKELVMDRLGAAVEYAVQAEQLGTGHAALQAEAALGDFPGDILILSGDVPLLKVETIRALLELHRRDRNDCTLVSCEFADPGDYGRIVRGAAGEVLGIVEHEDASEAQNRIREINSGIYFVKGPLLFEALKSLRNDNFQGEFYLTDIVDYFVRRGQRVGGLVVADPLEIAGVNSTQQLFELEKELERRNN